MEKIEYLGEILMRFGPAGLVGAHQITMTRYVDGETILTETAGMAEPVAAESLAALVGQATADLVAANGTLQSQATELQAQVDALTAQLANGGGATQEPATDRVTARQFKLQLLAAGLLDEVEAWVASQDRAVQIAYESSSTFVRDEPMMQSGFAALGFTTEQADAFFTAAAEL